MRNRYIIMLVAALVLAVSTTETKAQNGTYMENSGIVNTAWSLNPSDLINLSNFDSRFGTARSMAMGGAFTSLGADLISGHINPAGLGLYRSSEVGITPAVTINNVSNSPVGSKSIWTQSESRTRFGLNNAGLALNVYQGSRGLTSATIAFSYNKMADFNYRSSMGYHDNQTIGNYFIRDVDGILYSEMEGDGKWGRIHPSKWASTAAYNTYFFNRYYEEYTTDEDGRLVPIPIYDDVYRMLGMGSGVAVDHNAHINSRGSVGEFAIAAGFNIQNKLYLGFTIGIVDYYNKQDIFYSEDYIDNNADVYPMQYSDLNQFRKFEGTGVNFKFGVIYSPIAGLRLGAAIHTPTFSDIKTKYQVYFRNRAEGDRSDNWELSPINEWSHDFNTPTRLLLGASYTFGTKGLVSVDYERTWYNGMRYKSGDHIDKSFYNDTFSDQLKGSNTIRAGVEYRPVNRLFLRAGFGYSGKNTSSKFNVNPTLDQASGDMIVSSFDSDITYKSYNASGGIGIQLSPFASFDLTYTYFRQSRTSYDNYYFVLDPDPITEIVEGKFTPIIVDSPKVRPDFKRHGITFSLNFRF